MSSTPRQATGRRRLKAAGGSFCHSVFLLAAAALAASVHGRPPSGEEEEWHRVLLNGKPAGFHRQNVRPLPGGNTATAVLQRLRVSRIDQPLELEVEYEVEEDAVGSIARFSMVQRMAAAAVVTRGEVRGDALEITVSGAGAPRRHTLRVDPRALGPRALDRLLREKLVRPDDSVTAATFFPESASFGKLTATLGSEELVQFPGGARRLTRRIGRIDILPGSDLNEWIDGEGKVWKTSARLLGMDLETHRSSAGEILREKYASPPEVFLASSIRPDRPLRDPVGAREVVYRFRLEEGDFRSRGIERMFQGTGQTLVKEESPSVRVVRIGRVAPGRGVKLPVGSDGAVGLKDSLAPNAFIESDDPEVKRLAAEAAGSEDDAFRAARKLEAWVRNNVQFKDLKTPFASAKETAARREGDCTEHGVLLAAMARARGIPARVVSGLVYHDGAFVGHLWTEVFIDRWVPLDGTRGRGEVGPDHIALTASALATSSASELFLELAQVMGNLRIEVLEER